MDMKKTGFSLFFLLILFSGFTQSNERQVIFSPEAPKVVGPYSHAILAGNTLYVSGQIGIDPATGQMDTLNFETEFRRVLSNIELILEEAGMTFENVVKATIYTTDLKHYKLINTIYGEKFKEIYPARETVQVSALPVGANVEVSCIAVNLTP
jgi:2-iminobutanoate/2-iminopropanoate deaminase